MRVLGKQVVYDTSLLSFEPPNGPHVHPTPTLHGRADRLGARLGVYICTIHVYNARTHVRTFQERTLHINFMQPNVAVFPFMETWNTSETFPSFIAEIDSEYWKL